MHLKITSNSVKRKKAEKRFEMIDADMKKQKCWVCYLDKDTIVNPETGEAAYNDNPSTWGSFASACDYINNHKDYTLGYELGQHPILTAVHISNCITTEKLLKNADIDKIVFAMDSYSEIDLAGNGITFLTGNGGQRTLVDQLKDNKISKDGIEIELFDFNECIPLTGAYCLVDSIQEEGIPSAEHFNTDYPLSYSPRPINFIYELFYGNGNAEAKEEKVSDTTVTNTVSGISEYTNKKLNNLIQTNQYFKNLWYRTEPSDKGKDYDDINLIARLYAKISDNIKDVQKIFMASPYFEAKEGKEGKKFSGVWPDVNVNPFTINLLDGTITYCDVADTKGDPSVNSIVRKAYKLSVQEGFMDYDNDIRFLLDPLYETLIALDTDMDCSKLLMSTYGDRMKFCSEDNCWYIYNGHYWERENNNDLEHIRKYGGELTNRIESVINWSSFTKFQKKALRSNIKKYANVASFKRILEAARSVDPVGAGIFNTQKHLLKVGNGTLNLKTGKLVPDNREDAFSICVDVPYYRSLPEPKMFKRFLNTIFENDKNLIEYVHRLLGYCITGETKEQMFFVFYGTGANGKSTLINILQSVLNDYVGSFDSYALARKDDGSGKANPTLIQNRYCRLVAVSERNDRAEMDISLIKAITGGDKINTRMLFQNNIKPFAPMYKIVFTANKLPKIDWDDYGIRRRYKVIHFNKTLTDEEIDLDLEKKILANEKETILKWLADGAKMYYKDGLGEEPEAVKKAMFNARYKEDSVFAYAVSRIEHDANEMIQSGDVEKDYEAWCEENDIKAVAKNVLGERLKKILDVEKKMKTAKRTMHYIGVKFKDANNSEQNEDVPPEEQ